MSGRCGEHLVYFSRGEGERVLAGELDCLLEREEPLLAELYHKLRGSLLAPRTAVPDRCPTMTPPWSGRARGPNYGQEASAKMRL